LQAAASSPGGSAAQRGPAVVDARPLLPEPGMGVFKQDEQQAWRELAPLWGWQASAGAAGDFCQAARAQRLRCFRTSAGTLTQLRQLDRPATLLLRIDDGPPRLARLVALDGRRAVLAAGATAYSLSLDDLARSWRGEFTTLARRARRSRRWRRAWRPNAGCPHHRPARRWTAPWQPSWRRSSGPRA
jgi:hypothetical protein